MKPRNAKEEYLARQSQLLLPGVSPGAIRLRVLDLFRADLFKGLLADAMLHRLYPLAGRQDGEPPAAIAILLSRFSANAVGLAQKYVADFCPDLDWLVMDMGGRVSCSRRGQLSEHRVEPFRKFISDDPFDAAPRRMFSSNNQWFLKVMLLSGMESRYWGGPDQRKLASVSDLVRLADKPQPSASTFLQIAEKQEWVTRQDDGFAWHRIPQLLEEWSHHLRNNPDRAVPVASIYPGEAVEAVLQRLRGREGVVIGGHFGAHALGLGISNVRTPRIYVRDLEAGLETLALTKAPPGHAVAMLAQPKAADAVFKGAVKARENVRVADILQVYLDVRLSLARGEEQADHIYQRVLAPFFRKQQWL